ncbi:RNA-directed DNA polymerase, eukaryota [Tanacetum coccineum]
MSIFKCPMGVLKLLEFIRRNFSNGVTNSERKLALIGWKKVMASKKMEDLAFQVFLLLIEGYSLNGYSVSSPIAPLYGLGLSRLFMVQKVFSIILVSLQDVLLGLISDSSLVASFRREPRGGIEEEQLRLLDDSLGQFILPQSMNRWVWNLESSGEFSVKSARTFIDNCLLPKLEVPTRWIKVVPIKINIFAWKVFLDKLPMRLNLSLRGVEIPSILCPLCSIALESFSHLLFSCHLARQLIFKVARTCYVMWWTIWNFRNQVLFGSK